MTTLPRNMPTVARLGYEGLVAAMSLRAGTMPIEIGIVAPGHAYGDGWHVVEHLDCDPEEDTRGLSNVEDYATREEAEARFEELATSEGRSIVHPGYVVGADRKHGGGRSYIGRDDGSPSFVESLSAKDLIDRAVAASSSLSGVGHLKTYYGADRLDFGTFAIYEATTLTKKVEVDPARLAEAPGVKPPAGWVFAVCDALQTEFATNARHWSRTGSLEHARPYFDLGSALEAASDAGEGFGTIVMRHEIGSVPVPTAEMASRAETEKELATLPVPLETLDDAATFKPFG